MQTNPSLNSHDPKRKSPMDLPWCGGELYHRTLSRLGRRERKAANEGCFCVAVSSPTLRRRGVVAMELFSFHPL